MEYLVRAIAKEDLPIIQEMDEESTFNVVHEIEDVLSSGEKQNYAFCMEHHHEIIGYCTLECADYWEPWKLSHAYTDDSLCLSNVFIREKYQGNHLGYVMIKKALSQRWLADKKVTSVFLTLLNNRLSSYYEALGFTDFYEVEDSGDMVLDVKNLPINFFLFSYVRDIWRDTFIPKIIQEASTSELLLKHAQLVYDGKSYDKVCIDMENEILYRTEVK